MTSKVETLTPTILEALKIQALREHLNQDTAATVGDPAEKARLQQEKLLLEQALLVICAELKIACGIALPTSQGEIIVSTAFDGSPRLLMSHTSGDRISAWVTPTGHTMLDVYAPTGERALSINTATQTGAAILMLHDPNTGQPAWSITLDETGKPVITDHTE